MQKKNPEPVGDIFSLYTIFSLSASAFFVAFEFGKNR
jgi:hypothetical protein